MDTTPPVTEVRALSAGSIIPISFPGTPGKANCYGQNVSGLAKQFKGLNAAAANLGISGGVPALQSFIMNVCDG